MSTIMATASIVVLSKESRGGGWFGGYNDRVVRASVTPHGHESYYDAITPTVLGFHKLRFGRTQQVLGLRHVSV